MLARMRITWTVEDLGGNAADAETADGAAEALAGGIRELYAGYETATLAHIMLNVVAPLRMALVTDGRYEVERGREWSTSMHGISVTLAPN